MPKFNLHLATKQPSEEFVYTSYPSGLPKVYKDNFHTDMDLDSIQWNQSLLVVQPKFQKVTQKNALKLVLLNVAKYEDSRILYSRRNEKTQPIEHNPHQISWKSIAGVIDALIKNGIVTATKGDKWYTTDPDERHTSSFVADWKLIDIAKELFPESEVIEEQRSHIEFKDSRGNHIEYEQTPYTERVELIMKEISEHTNRQKITLDSESLLPINYLRKYKDYDSSREFRFGGRAYPSHTSIRKEDRPRILINGQRTESVDYSSSVPSLVYSIMTSTPRDQVEELVAPYQVEGMSRKVAKRIVNIMLNSTKKNVHRGIGGHFNHPKTDSEEKQDFALAKEHFGNGYLDKMIEAVVEKNKGISQAFLQGRSWGQHWSWIEANIVYETAHYMTKHLDMPLLVVHDEFIVPEEHAVYVPDYMYTVGLPDCYESKFTNAIYSHEPQV